MAVDSTRVQVDTSPPEPDEPAQPDGVAPAEPADDGGEVAAAGDSQLAAIREKHRRQRQESRYTDLPVPHLDEPPVYVRYTTAINHDRIRRFYNKREKQGKQKGGYDWEVKAAADVLVEACQGVYTVLDDGSKVGYALDGDADDWPAFDLRLAKMLDLDGQPSALDVCRALYGTDPRVIQASGQLANIVGYNPEEGMPGE